MISSEVVFSAMEQGKQPTTMCCISLISVQWCIDQL